MNEKLCNYRNFFAIVVKANIIKYIFKITTSAMWGKL